MSSPEKSSPDDKNAEVVFLNVKEGKTFFSLTSQEARRAVEFVKLMRQGINVENWQDYRQSIIWLYEKNAISTTKLLESFGIDYEDEVEKIRFERANNPCETVTNSVVSVKSEERAEEQTHWQSEFDVIKGVLHRLESNLNADKKDGAAIYISQERFKSVFDDFLAKAKTKQNKLFIMSIAEALGS